MKLEINVVQFSWCAVFVFTGQIKYSKKIYAAIKNFGENGAWAYTGTAQIFWVPPIISGTDKATNFKFCTHILSIDQNNSPLKISGAVAACVVRTLKTFKCTHILGALRGLLCDSYAVLLCYWYCIYPFSLQWVLVISILPSPCLLVFAYCRKDDLFVYYIDIAF